MRYEIGMSGTGGQGTILLGAILAESLSEKEGIFVAQTKAYDPAVRGSKAESFLVISDEEIDWHGPFQLDILLALSQDAYENNIKRLKPEGILIIDPQYVGKAAGAKVLSFPFTQVARNKFNDERVVNMLCAGFLLEYCSYFSEEAVKSAMSANFKGKVLETNLAAFKEGIECGKQGLKEGFANIESSEDTQI
jgi:2-oxoglutarate ferredoxin oxidoreductase subunit gamma